MADLHTHTNQTPLLGSLQNQHAGNEDDEEDTFLERNLESLKMFLSVLGFRQCSLLSFALSWTGFVVIGLLVPVLVLEVSDCGGCSEYQIKSFELDIVVSQVCLAAVSLGCLAHNLSKYGIRKFLFVDRYSGQVSRLRDQYILQIRGSLRLLVFWSLPCLILKAAREIIRILYVQHESWWISISVSLALILSWTYLCTITLSASILFHLVCKLQVIHFDDYAQLLERESDVVVLMEEHIRLRYHLSKISHRFRIYLLLVFWVVTISQFVTLFRTTGYSDMITFLNGGDFAVSSLVQVVGITFCLHGATRISHRAQNIASLAGRWHASITLTSNESSVSRHPNSMGNLEAANHLNSSLSRHPNSMGNLEAANHLNSLHLDYSESDLESLDFAGMPTNTQLASYMSSYHKRQALVMYLQTNPGGITIFGWTVDRGLINTIFFMELTLITFILGKTIVLSSSSSDNLDHSVST